MVLQDAAKKFSKIWGEPETKMSEKKNQDNLFDIWLFSPRVFIETFWLKAQR